MAGLQSLPAAAELIHRLVAIEQNYQEASTVGSRGGSRIRETGVRHAHASGPRSKSAP